MAGVAEASAEEELRAAWAALGGDDATADDLVARHREPHRRYHTVAHVAWVLRVVEDLLPSDAVADPDAVRVAALFHDAIYDTRRADNEARSADLAVTAADGVLRWPSMRSVEIRRLILATMTHQPADADEAVLLDADLSILGAEAATYDRYVAAVREEYAHVDNAGWREGRSNVLRHFLDRPQIYATVRMQARAENQARANLARELAALG